MKRCPQCNRLYADMTDKCPQCNIMLPGSAAQAQTQQTWQNQQNQQTQQTWQNQQTQQNRQTQQTWQNKVPAGSRMTANPMGLAIWSVSQKTPIFLIFGGVFLIVFALGASVNVLQLVNSLASSASSGLDSIMSSALDTDILSDIFSGLGGELVSYFGGSMFGSALLFSALSRIVLLILTTLLVWLVSTIVLKHGASFLKAVNLTCTATIFMTIISILNMLIGFIPVPLTIVTGLAGETIFIVVLFEGIREITGKEAKNIFVPFAISVVIVMLILCALDCLFAVGTVQMFILNLESQLLNAIGF